LKQQIKPLWRILGLPSPTTVGDFFASRSVLPEEILNDKIAILHLGEWR